MFAQPPYAKRGNEIAGRARNAGKGLHPTTPDPSLGKEGNCLQANADKNNDTGNENGFRGYRCH